MSERQGPPPPDDMPRPSPRRRRLFFVGLAVVLPVVALVVAVAVLMQVMGWSKFSQPSGSMLPTLVVGDYFVIDTRAYTAGRHPGYGDVIAFHVPGQVFGQPATAGRGAPFVKRVVGLPGDQISLAAGVLTVNGKPLPQQPVGEFAARPGQKQKTVRLREQAPNGVTYDILRYTTSRSVDTGRPYAMPAGRYFVMGDNRDDSLDGRYWVQRADWYVPLGDIIGRATYIYWSGFERLDRIAMALK